MCTVEIKNRWIYSCLMCLHGLDRDSFVFTSFCVDFLKTVDPDRPCYIFVCTERVTETGPSRCYSSLAVGEDGCVKWLNRVLSGHYTQAELHIEQ